MKHIHNAISSVIIIFSIMGCSLGSKQIKPVDPILTEAETRLFENAGKTVGFAFDYYDQGGLEKSAELMIEAADMYHQVNGVDREKRALIAAAQIQLKYYAIEKFMATMNRYKNLLDDYEMPGETERFLVTLAEKMAGQTNLTYPVQYEWRAVIH